MKTPVFYCSTSPLGYNVARDKGFGCVTGKRPKYRNESHECSLWAAKKHFRKTFAGIQLDSGQW